MFRCIVDLLRSWELISVYSTFPIKHSLNEIKYIGIWQLALTRLSCIEIDLKFHFQWVMYIAGIFIYYTTLRSGRSPEPQPR